MKNKSLLLNSLVASVFCFSLIIAPLALAAETADECSESISAGVQCFGSEAFGQDEAPSLISVVAGVINVLLGLLGLIFLIMIIYGGLTWMTSMGQEEKIKKAKQAITNAAIGLIIILVSYAVVNFVFFALSEYVIE